MQLLLCSDGLTEEVDDRGISQVLAPSECIAQECVDGLVAAALDGGGSDNVTVVLVGRHCVLAVAHSGATGAIGRADHLTPATIVPLVRLLLLEKHKNSST